ncbi:MAG TPA: hypothetical protein VK536_07330 [Candidatus Limnocylindrales bacterium]|nr:hypothetical protein [Candidatus Limnocylindrales bacterium]
MSSSTGDKENASGMIDWPLRSGIFLVAVSWFVYFLYDDILGVYNRHTTLPLVKEDIPAAIGLGFAVAASAATVLTLLFYLCKRDLSKPETTMAVRLILFSEAVYFVLGFLPSVFVEGLPGTFHFTIQKLFEVGLPSLVDATAIPTVLVKLFLTLNPSKPAKETIKWGLIAGTVYLFAFWISNAGNWIGAAIAKGVNYIIDYPVNMFSFILTTVGLLLLSLYAAYFSRKTIGKGNLTRFDLKKVGLILTATGMYLTLTLLLWFIFGSVGGWGTWYAWLLGHGYLDLWGLTLPFIGLPLLFYTESRAAQTAPNPNRASLQPVNRKQLNALFFIVEGLGITFYAVLSAAYYATIPSTKVLTGEPIFHIPITIFGLLYFIATIIVVLVSTIKKKTKEK